MAEIPSPFIAGDEYNLGALNDAITVEHAEGLTGFYGIQVEDKTGTLTLAFEATVNKGTDWVPIAALDLSDFSTYATTTTADGLFRVDGSGLWKFRIRISAYVSGSANVAVMPHIG